MPSVPYLNGGSPSLRDRRLSQIWRQNRQFTDLFPLPATTKVGGMIHHPKLWNDFSDQMSVTE
jgi:hypothetical protein